MDNPAPSPPRWTGWALVLLAAPLLLLEAVVLGLEPAPLPFLHRALPGLLSLSALAVLARAFLPTSVGQGAGLLVAASIGAATSCVSGFQPGPLQGLQTGLHLAFGAALIAGATLLAARRRPAPRGLALAKQVVLHEGQDRSPKKVDVAQVVAGQQVGLIAGAGLVPLDGRVVQGAASAQLSPLFAGAPALTKREGDPLLAGSRVEGELVLEVVRPPEQSFYGEVRRHVAALIEQVERSDRYERSLVALVGLGALAAAGLAIASAPEADWLSRAARLGSIGLLASAAPAILARRRVRRRIIELLAARGVYLGDSQELPHLLGYRSVGIAPELASGPGEVELRPLGDISSPDLLGVATALFAEDDGPVASTLRAELERQGLGPLRSAAQRRTQAVFHGTVGGIRWYIGPALAVEQEEKAALDERGAEAMAALSARCPIVLVCGRPDRGIVGLVGVSIGSDETISTLGRALGASLLPGLPDVVREAIGRSSGLSVRARPLKRRDLAILRFRDLPPSDGLILRVAPESELLRHRLSDLAIVAEPALPFLPETVALARRMRRLGWARTALYALSPLLGLLVLLSWPAIPPLFVAAFGLGLVAAATAI